MIGKVGHPKLHVSFKIFDSRIVPMLRYGSEIWGHMYQDQIEKIHVNRKNDLILIMTPEKQDKTLELSKHWSVDSTPARNEVIMKRTYPVKSIKCDKICSNY